MTQGGNTEYLSSPVCTSHDLNEWGGPEGFQQAHDVTGFVFQDKSSGNRMRNELEKKKKDKSGFSAEDAPAETLTGFSSPLHLSCHLAHGD